MGCATWQQRKEEANLDAAFGRPARRLSFYCFGTDAGGENVGMAMRVCRALNGCLPVMFCYVFCYMHQLHLIVKAIFVVLDTWKWDVIHIERDADQEPAIPAVPENDPADLEEGDVGIDDIARGLVHVREDIQELPSTYFNGVSSCSSTWRSTGNPRGINEAAVHVCGQAIADRYFRVSPGRCLRGRWLSAEHVEKVIRTTLPFIGRIWSHIWGRQLPEDAPGGIRAHEPQGLLGQGFLGSPNHRPHHFLGLQFLWNRPPRLHPTAARCSIT